VGKCRIVAAAVIWTAPLLCGLAQGAGSKSTPAAKADDPKHAGEIVRLVRELGAPTFIARQHAQRALVTLGVDAKPALEAACHDPDHEIRQRARTALAAISDVDFHVRVAEFLADQNLEDGHGLAGWERYRSLVGSDPAARTLFADMQRAERELLEAVAQKPSHAGSLLDARCQQLASLVPDGDNIRQPQYSLSTMAALVFAASDRDVPITERAGDYLNGLGGQTVLNQAIHSRPTDTLFRALLNAWVGRPLERDSRMSYGALLLAMQFDLKGAVVPALKLIDPPPVGSPMLEQWAILAIAKLGSREHVESLEPLLADERSIPDRGGRESDVQVRDLALAAMIHLSGQKLADYGFVHAKSNPFYLFNTNTLGFNDPSARTEALKKWRAWQAKQEK
jgi:hypothetical protein